MTAESRDGRAWEQFVEGVQSALPEWARYSGYGTYAIAGYIYGFLLPLVAFAFYSWGNSSLAVVFGLFGVVSWSIGSYYRGAAKVRVTCDRCGEPARGRSNCPHCGESTFRGGNE